MEAAQGDRAGQVRTRSTGGPVEEVNGTVIQHCSAAVEPGSTDQKSLNPSALKSPAELMEEPRKSVSPAP